MAVVMEPTQRRNGLRLTGKRFENGRRSIQGGDLTGTGKVIARVNMLKCLGCRSILMLSWRVK